MKNFTKILLAAWLFFGPMYAAAQQSDTLEILHDTKGGVSFVRFKPEFHN